MVLAWRAESALQRDAGPALTTPAHIHDPAVLVQREVEALLALDAVQGERIIPSAGK
jgi:hypothetical protein